MANRLDYNSRWLTTCNSLAIALSASSILSLGAIFYSDVAAAQNYPYPESGGVRSRVIPPTPLNISPRTHIPLPRSNRSYYRDAYRDYDRYERSENCEGDRYRHRRSRSRSYNQRTIRSEPNFHRNPSTVNYIRIIR